MKSMCMKNAIYVKICILHTIFVSEILFAIKETYLKREQEFLLLLNIQGDYHKDGMYTK